MLVPIQTTTFLNKLKPKDIIAVIVLIFAFISMIKGINATMSTITALILGYYFTHREKQGQVI